MLGGRALRYEELEPGTRRVAALLEIFGARPGDRVAILAENSPAWGLAYLGLARSGCVAVPILTDFTGEQIANILDHSESRIVFASRRFLPKLNAGGAAAGRRLVAIEDLALLAAGRASTPEAVHSPAPHSPPPAIEATARTAAFPDAAALEAAMARLALPEIRADDLAAIVYTSGTTGHSKGVMLTHRNIVHNAWAVGISSLEAGTTASSPSSPSPTPTSSAIGFSYPSCTARPSTSWTGRPRPRRSSRRWPRYGPASC